MILQDLGQIPEATAHFLRSRALHPDDVASSQSGTVEFSYPHPLRLGAGRAEQDRGSRLQSERLVRAETALGFPRKSFGILPARINCPDGARACFKTHLLHDPGDEHDVAMPLAAVCG